MIQRYRCLDQVESCRGAEPTINQPSRDGWRLEAIQRAFMFSYVWFVCEVLWSDGASSNGSNVSQVIEQ